MIRLYDGMYPMPNDMLAEIGPPPDVAIRRRSSNPRRDPPTPPRRKDAMPERPDDSTISILRPRGLSHLIMTFPC